MLFLFLLILVIVILPKYMWYRNSNYKISSGNSFIKTVFDKGNYGEFITYRYLEELGTNNKLMVNLYLPKSDGSTTEVDLIMISQTGIYVFESKNYGGWIFGNEKDKQWTQMFKNRQKYRFYNPIWQNNGHINALKLVVGIDNENLYKSYIIFSERCELKKITVTSDNVKVMKRNALLRTIKKDISTSKELLTNEQVEKLYLELKQYTCVDEAIKKAHIEDIHKKLS